MKLPSLKILIDQVIELAETSKKGRKECKERERISSWSDVDFLIEATRGLLSIISQEISFNKRDTENDPNKPVAILIPGFILTENSMTKLRAGLKDNGYNTWSPPDRITVSRLSIIQTIKRIQKKIQDAERLNQEVVIIGYSIGGNTLQSRGKIWGKHKNVRQMISYEASDKAYGIPSTIFAHLFGHEHEKGQVSPISPNVEFLCAGYSAFNPNVGLRRDDEGKYYLNRKNEEIEVHPIEGVHTHYSIDHPKVVEAIIDSVRRNSL